MLAAAIASPCPSDPVAADLISRTNFDFQSLAPGAFRARAPPSA